MTITRKKPLPRSTKPIARAKKSRPDWLTITNAQFKAIDKEQSKERLARRRTYKTPRCDVGRCKKPQDVKWTTFEGKAKYVGADAWTNAIHHGMCKSHATAEADRRFSRFIRDRDMECRIKTETGCVGPLQCCHLLSRRFHAARWDEGNAVAGCAGHHAYWTRNPDRWAAWLDENNTVELALLRDRAFHGDPMDVADVLARYPAAKKEKAE